MSLAFGCFVTCVMCVMGHFWSCKVSTKYCNLTLNSRKETIRQSIMCAVNQIIISKIITGFILPKIHAIGSTVISDCWYGINLITLKKSPSDNTRKIPRCSVQDIQLILCFPSLVSIEWRTFAQISSSFRCTNSNTSERSLIHKGVAASMHWTRSIYPFQVTFLFKSFGYILRLSQRKEGQIPKSFRTWV